MNPVRKSKTTYSLFQCNYLQFLSDNPWIQCPHCKTAGNFIRDGKIPYNNKFNLKCKSCLKKISEDSLLKSLLDLKIVNRSLVDSWASPTTTISDSSTMIPRQDPIPVSPGLPLPVPTPRSHTPSPLPRATSDLPTEALEAQVRLLSDTLAQKESIIISMMQQIERLTSELSAWKEASKNLDNIIQQEQPPIQHPTPRTKRRRQDSPSIGETNQDPAPQWSTMGKKNRVMTQSQRILIGIKSTSHPIMEPTQEYTAGPAPNSQEEPTRRNNNKKKIKITCLNGTSY
jgi:predicted Zn finger-like uncharacterized protein